MQKQQQQLLGDQQLQLQAKNSTKRSTYTQFMKLTAQQRKIQSDHLREMKQNHIPVLLSFYKKQKLEFELPNCKFLVEKNRLIGVEFNKIKQYILKNRQLNSSQTLYFAYQRKVLNGGQKIADFIESTWKDKYSDGWVHLEYAVQDWSG